MRFRFTVLLLLLAITLGTPSPARAQAPCLASVELLDVSALPATARAVARGSLAVLVVGSASVNGPGGSGAAASYPRQLEALLRARLPGVRVEVSVRGGRGLAAETQAALIAEVLARSPRQLVIWQAGTVETVRGSDIAEMVTILGEGADIVRRHGADLVFMDQQFSRFLRGNADVDPYREALRRVAAAAGAGLFRRWDLMLSWAESGAVDAERASGEQQVVEVDRLNACLGAALTEFLVQGSRKREN